MGKNILVEALRASDAERGKKADKYFDCNASVISYSTGFPVLDYYLGYKVNVCDENGKPVEISIRERGEGERMIEDFMVAANEAVATTIFYMQLPGIYRVHDKPSEEKLTDFIHFCEVNGQHLTAMKTVNPREYQKLLNSNYALIILHQSNKSKRKLYLFLRKNVYYNKNT